MELYVITYSSLFLTALYAQKIQYVSRFRNFSVESETGDMYLINCTIYQKNLDHALAGIVNVTNDILVKNVNTILYRCNFENFACENFLQWNFTGKDVKSVIHMKNQIWSPLIDDFDPELDPPLIKKNIYRGSGATLDTKAALLFYPDVTKYFWKVHVIGIDMRNKKAGILKFENAFYTFVEGNRKHKRRSTTIKP